MRKILVNGCSALSLRRTYALGIAFHPNMRSHANSKLLSSIFNERPVEVIAIVRHENRWRSQSEFQKEPFKKGTLIELVVYKKLSAIFLRHRLVGAPAGRYSKPIAGIKFSVDRESV